MLRVRALLCLCLSCAGCAADAVHDAAGSGGSDGSGVSTGGAPALPPSTSGSGGADLGTGGHPVIGAGGSGGSAPMTATRDAGPVAAHDAAVASDGGMRDAGPPLDLPGGASGMFPLPNASGVCADPALRIAFASPPALGTTGQVAVFDAAAPALPVALIDMAVPTTTQMIGGTQFNVPRTAFIDGNALVLRLSQPLAHAKTYFVHVDAGAVLAPNGVPFTISDDSSWRFTTGDAPANAALLHVALDGSGEYCSVQGALDALPAANSTAVRIEIGDGTYYEIIHFTNKNNVTLHGHDRKKTIIAGTNNNNLNPSTATRALVGVDKSSGLVIENLTIANLTAQGGSQAEALRLQSCDQCIVRDADITSLQDTLLWSGRIYADNCLIAGNVDFIWGTGAAYFNACEIKTVGRSGYNVQARNAAGAYGYVFVDCKLTSDPGITGSTLARIDDSAYPASQVAYVDCEVGSHISAAGWTITGLGSTSALRFQEYGSKTPSGAAVDTSQRASGSTPLTQSQAMMLRDPSVVLSGWTPN